MILASCSKMATYSTDSALCSFTALCEGANGYVCDPSCLVDLLEVESESTTPISVAAKLINKKFDAIIRELEIERGCEVKILHIGKACIKKRIKKGGEYQPLDRMDPSTWIRSAIASRWRRHRSKGRDGMIVLTAITRETTPNGINQQEYALELQEKLIEIYKTDNKSKLLGAENPDGYALYAAFNIEWRRYDIPASSFGFEYHEDDDDDGYEPAIDSHPPTNKQSSTYRTTSLGGNRSHFTGSQDRDLPPTKIWKVSSEEDHIYSPLSVTTAESTTTRKPYSSLVGAARPKRSARKISLAADPKQIPSLSKHKITQGPHVSFPPTRKLHTLHSLQCLPSQAVLTPLSPNEAVTPSLNGNSIPYTNSPDEAIFGSPPSPPLTPDNTESPSSVIPSVAPFVARCVTFNILNMATLSPTRAPQSDISTAAVFQYSPQQQQTVSRTTLGGCTFEDLCKGAVNYACDPSCLVALCKTNAVDEVVQLLEEKLEDNIRGLEIARDGKVTKIYIGKTFIKQRRKRGGFQQFDPMQPTTWKKNGISSRWGSHKALGRHGLIVLTAVTRELAPVGLNQQDYALMLEQKLMHHYKLKNDTRLENETFGEGARTKILAYGYALYVAFIIEVDDEDTPIFTDDDIDYDDSAVLTSIETYQPPSLPSNIISDGNESTIVSPPTSFAQLDQSLYSQEKKSDTECQDCSNKALHTLGNMLLAAFVVTLISVILSSMLFTG